MLRIQMGAGYQIAVAMTVLSTLTTACLAQSPNRRVAAGTPTPVVQASFQTDRQCKFSYRPAQAGEQYRQHVQYDVDIKTQIRQSGQTVANSQQRVKQLQERLVEVLPNPPGSSAVRVTFDKAEQQVGGAGEMLDVPQPVQGKTYLVARAGDQPLTITHVDGTPISPAEADIVRVAMNAVGRSNPIGEFLNGKTIGIGQVVELPADLASGMFSTSGQTAPAEAVSFTMSLREIGMNKGHPTATFETSIVLRDKQQADGQLNVLGRMSLDIDSCRALTTDISSPLHVVEQRGPKQASFTVEGRGQMKLATRTSFE